MKGNAYDRVIWIVVGFALVMATVCGLSNNPSILAVAPPILYLLAISFTCIHGIKRYGVKNLFVYCVIALCISVFLEAVSIHTGFPFGNYYHTDLIIGPRIYDVPYTVGLTYIVTGYISWTMAHILTGQYSKKLEGIQLLTVPVVAAFLNTAWDVSIDPIGSTVLNFWVWKDSGTYFGVPMSNYAGWFLCCYLIFQCFALYIAQHDTKSGASDQSRLGKGFWYQAILLYFHLALPFLLLPFSKIAHAEIFDSMALITTFTMLLPTVLSLAVMQSFDTLQNS
jgi:putative membrane protein